MPLSTLARELHIEFSGKCEQTVGGSKGTCTEPIKPVLAYGELGLLHGHVLLLVAPETGTEFVEVRCTNGNTKIGGAVIGEFPLNGRGGSSQYEVALEDFLLLLKAKGTTQEPEEIELLGSLMTGVALKVEGFFGEKPSVEAAELLLFDGLAQIQPPPRLRIGITPIENDRRERRCPINRAGKAVEFRTERVSWCEYEIKNELAEVIHIAAVRLNLPPTNEKDECERAREECIISEAPELRRVECAARGELEPRGMARSVCYLKLKYNRRPAVAPRIIDFDVIGTIQPKPRTLVGAASAQEVV